MIPAVRRPPLLRSHHRTKPAVGMPFGVETETDRSSCKSRSEARTSPTECSPRNPRLLRGLVASTRRRQRLRGDGLTSLGGSVSAGSGVGSGGGSGRSGCKWTGAPCSSRWRTGDRRDMWGVGAHGGGLCSYGLRYPLVWVNGCDRGHRFDVTQLVEAVSTGDYTGLPRQFTQCRRYPETRELVFWPGLR